MNRNYAIIVLLVMLVALTVFSSNEISRLKKVEKSYDDVVYQRDVYKGNLADVSQVVVDQKRAIDISKQDSAALANEYQRKIWAIMNEAKKNGIKPKDVVSGTSAEIVAKDTFQVKIRTPCFIDTLLRHRYYSVYVRYSNDSLKVKPEYRGKVSSIVYVMAKYRKDGKPHLLFPKWKLLWGTEMRNIVTLDDTSAKIENAFSVRYE